MGLEPLPDVDFNIRTGNTLIGFATEKELNRAFDGKFDFDNDTEKIKEKCDIVARTFTRYKEIQLTYSDDFEHFKEAKEELNKRLKELNHELSQLLHKQSYSNIAYQKWLATHQPFHWFAEFYEIIHDKCGFDVIIGNPPYVEYTENKFPYRINGNQFKSFPSRNLYSLIYERAKCLLHSCSRIGLIVQISSVSTPTMETMVKEIKRDSKINWISNYATRPAYLFDGVTMNLTIILTEILKSNKTIQPTLFSSHYLRWNPEYRQYLFQYIPLNKVDNTKLLFEYSIPKLKSEKENWILEKILSQNKIIQHYLELTKNNTTKQELFYRTAGGRYFKVFVDRDFGSESKSNKSKYFQNKYSVYVMISVLSSDLWWWYYTLHFDMYNCKDYMIFNFPFDYENCKKLSELEKLGKKLSKDLIENSEKKLQSYTSTGDRMQLIFKPSLSKPIIDEIDKVLAEHYGFTNEELDFIINYDIKYRMGKELEGEDEE